MSEHLHLRYNKAFQDKSHGYALLHPPTTERLHVGVCGYFDGEGDWKTIVDIPKLKDLKSEKEGWFKPIYGLPAVPRGPPVRWEPKVASDITFTKDSADGDAKVSKPGIAQSFDKFQFKRTEKSDFGAVLVAEAPVHQDYSPDDVLFYEWLKDNIPAFIKHYPELIESGIPLWIVTKIYHTSKCSIACWDNDQLDVSLDFGLTLTVPAVGAAEASATPGGEKVVVKTTGPGWAHYGITELLGSTTTHPSCGSTTVGEDAEEHDFVLFVSGLRFTAQTDLIGRPTQSFNVDDGRRTWTVTHFPEEGGE